ncbi:MAG: hypothetical protein KAQ84_03555 [Thermoplasmatales archaeon]|nr:hypothetical protein [Thermoplasmatales archaeon]MCK5260622.1 hypothetical protein [Thermoplasmatales archaeon]
MRKKIIIGSLLAVFLMMMLPTVSTIESDAVKETMKSQNPIIIPDIDIEELKLKYQNGPEPTFFLIFILKQILSLLRMIKFTALFAVLLIIIKRIFGNSTAIIS